MRNILGIFLLFITFYSVAQSENKNTAPTSNMDACYKYDSLKRKNEKIEKDKNQLIARKDKEILDAMNEIERAEELWRRSFSPENNKSKSRLISQEEKNLRDLCYAEIEQDHNRRGPNFCRSLKNISISVAEQLAGNLRVNPLQISFNRSFYEYPNIHDGLTCNVVLYTPHGVLTCKTYEANVSSGIVTWTNSCKGNW